MTRALSRACSRERARLPAPSRIMVESFMPAAFALRPSRIMSAASWLVLLLVAPTFLYSTPSFEPSDIPMRMPLSGICLTAFHSLATSLSTPPLPGL